MAYLKIHNELLTAEAAARLEKLCPFGAITANGATIDIGAGCRMCKLCVKNSAGAVELVETEQIPIDHSGWVGVAVFVEHTDGDIHPVTFELLGKAKELAAVNSHPVYAVMIGADRKSAEKLLCYGADKVYLYSQPELSGFRIDLYANALSDFIDKVRPSSILVGATSLGRTLAPKVAARWKTGLTADCTRLEMKDNTDLVQIRPAFGGNIMAQIITPNNRPQFCTVRYKIFSAPEQTAPNGEIVEMTLSDDALISGVETIKTESRPSEIDISEAEIIVAAGRGVKTREDLAMLEKLASLLGAQMASTRPLIEAGWMDPRRQIGLSGRTVKPKLLIAAGISGSVQFAAGMQQSECIVAINTDPNASIFEIAHYGFIGDIYEVIPMLIAKLEGGN